ncbi:cysteine desulfurase family protein [Sphingomonas psychrolutea]|uniref:Cysteine desulfurase n=1 Tax=Sphingomonas psychrolutea TaxID=1259676 RepID=A0ABQ1GAS8_9SPHN|nr:cysteine desulfurase family protein [Sphingomonas psychrolutea]GGA40127.1 cysteine desulfurase IscS [Sphingomonas psychrolutea]
MIYLDYQATTPLAPEALDAMLPWLRDQHANPHSAHAAGRKAKAAVEFARDQVAAVLPPGGRVVFTSGATESLNWAIKGTTGEMVTLASEHAAVLDAVDAEARHGRSATVLAVDVDGVVDLAAANPAIQPGTGLVAAMLVNNEIGVVQPITELAEAAHRVGALFLCDAVQGYGRVPIPEGCDLIALSAHKIYGPKGIGALWIRDGVTLEPLLHGGDQEGGRSGTLSPALCAGFGRAAALMAERREADAVHIERLWVIATERLGLTPPLPGREGLRVGRPEAASTLSPYQPAPASGRSSHRDDLNHAGHGSPDARPRRGGWNINGSTQHRYYGNLNIRHDGLDVARLMSDLRDIAFSAGSACASGSGRSSHVLRALGLSEAQARSSIRLGFGRYTTEAELAEAIDRIIAAADAQQTIGDRAA